MDFFTRHRNTTMLAVLLFAQLLALALQVKRQTAEGPVRLIRIVSVNTIAPFERLLIYTGGGIRSVWTGYLDLRDVRRENERLKAEAAQMRLDREREMEDARQARRIQALLQFKENWIDKTVAAQVIGTSGTESSRLIYLDKGSGAGIKPDMPVITPDGVVGKVLNVYGDTSQVLLINDPSSGVGAMVVNARLQGIVKGSATGEVQLNYIMGDESVQSGEAVITSGGDRVFPKGLPIGRVTRVSMGRNLFLDIKVKPAADLDRLEEVLVVTEQKAREPQVDGQAPIRASDILAEHLPGVPQQPPAQGAAQAPNVSVPQTQTTSPAQPQPSAAHTQSSVASTQPPPAKPKSDLPAKPQSAAPASSSAATKAPSANAPAAKAAANPSAKAQAATAPHVPVVKPEVIKTNNAKPAGAAEETDKQ
jgi:rod shape-determining protein MreC